ncbi:MAG: alpha/beta hydrolase [Gammaproteobacteria bacterium]|jgi:pimeloyl-ACP methyl ester carboxylesterase|nr:alpha/beta hydrolase [Gammaproteobacteria bacterium]
MPILKSDRFDIDYVDAGSGPAVVLIHASASNNKQWRRIIEDNQDQYRFLAVNLFGYGDTTSWSGDVAQTIDDQVSLIEAVSGLVDEQVCLVGHSLGGAVAAYSAMTLGEKVSGLVLLEANPFPLLDKDEWQHAYEEIVALKDYVLHHGRDNNDWDKVGERFVNYWVGEGAWASLSAERQASFISALPNNRYEWDAVMQADVGEEVWKSISASTLVVHAKETKASTMGICEIFQQICPHWEFQEITEGGHMAPVTHPDLVNPLILDFLRKIF